MKRRYLDQQLKLRTLRAIDAIATHNSLLKSSQVLGVTQPALTRSLQEVEEIFGFRIFERHPRGVRLTAAGEVVWTATRRILAEVHRLDDELDRLLSGSAGFLAIGTLPVAAAGVMPGILARTEARFPDLQIRLLQGRTAELLPLLSSGELDFVVGRLYHPDVPDNFARETLYEEPLSIVARPGHPIFRQSRVSVAELARYKFILPTLNQKLGQEIEHLLSQIGLKGTVFMRSSSIGVTRELLHATDHMTVAPRILMTGDLVRGTIRIVPFEIPSPPRQAGLIYRRGVELSPAAAAMLDLIRQEVARIYAEFEAGPLPASPPTGGRKPLAAAS
jgi:LysR family pca operon transcriptional activator